MIDTMENPPDASQSMRIALISAGCAAAELGRLRSFLRTPTQLLSPAQLRGLRQGSGNWFLVAFVDNVQSLQDIPMKDCEATTLLAGIVALDCSSPLHEQPGWPPMFGPTKLGMLLLDRLLNCIQRVWYAENPPRPTA